MHTMSFKLGTVIHIPFPFSDPTGLKQRPALVISYEESKRETKQIICMMITSAKPVFSTVNNISDSAETPCRYIGGIEWLMGLSALFHRS